MPRLGLIDSGIGAHQPLLPVRFHALTGPDDRLDRLGHGSAIVETLGQYLVLSDLEVSLARLFDERLTASAERLIAALEWQAESPPDWLLCSMGLPRPHPRLCEVVEHLLAAGTRIVASSARFGAPVYPAAWPGVRAVSGAAGLAPGPPRQGADGRWYACVWSAVPGHWQAWMTGPRRRGALSAPGGASFAAAHALGYWLAGEAGSAGQSG